MEKRKPFLVWSSVFGTFPPPFSPCGLALDADVMGTPSYLQIFFMITRGRYSCSVMVKHCCRLGYYCGRGLLIRFLTINVVCAVPH